MGNGVLSVDGVDVGEVTDLQHVDKATRVVVVGGGSQIGRTAMIAARLNIVGVMRVRGEDMLHIRACTPTLSDMGLVFASVPDLDAPRNGPEKRYGPDIKKSRFPQKAAIKPMKNKQKGWR